MKADIESRTTHSSQQRRAVGSSRWAIETAVADQARSEGSTVLVVHGLLSAERGVGLWAEDATLPTKSPSQSLRTARPHPFAAPNAVSGMALTATAEDAVLLLPSLLSAPLDSPDLLRDVPRRASKTGPGLLPWRIPVCWLEPAEAVRLLSGDARARYAVRAIGALPRDDRRFRVGSGRSRPGAAGRRAGQDRWPGALAAGGAGPRPDGVAPVGRRDAAGVPGGGRSIPTTGRVATRTRSLRPSLTCSSTPSSVLDSLTGIPYWICDRRGAGGRSRPSPTPG